MIRTLAYFAEENENFPLFYTQTTSDTLSLSYQQVRFAAAALAKGLINRGYKKDTYLAINSFNSAEFIVLLLACAYAGFTLVILNPRLSDEERKIRMFELESATNQSDIPVVNESNLYRSIIETVGMSLSELSKLKNQDDLVSYFSYDLLYFAKSCEEKFNPSLSGVIMFTSGSSGVPKAAKLTWKNLIGAAQAANKRLLIPRKGVWQLAMPLCHVGGLEIFVRCLLNGNPFILYQKYSVTRILNDALTFNVTHISVVDKMLVDLLDNDHDRIISQYQCILLGGSSLNHKTIRRALHAKANVFASYGMTETSSLIACEKIDRRFNGGLKLLDGYQINIVRPDDKGIGLLNIKGPGIFSGYLNTHTSFTFDGWFVSGDRARLDRSGLIYIFERENDLIISGGENIYPEEIRQYLLKIPGVKDAYVFGTADEQWGYRPVAFIEADYSIQNIEKDYKELDLDPKQTQIYPASCPQEFARNIHHFLDCHMSKLYHPKHILVMSKFPRTVASKIDVQALKQLYDRRIDIKSVSLFRVEQPFVHPITTAKGTIETRESYFVELRDWAGRSGIGECVSFSTNWYLPETINDDYNITKDKIAEIVLNERYLHPREVSYSFSTFPILSKYPQAKSAIECAIWDLYGKIVAKPLYDLIGGEPIKFIPGGVVIGIMNAEDTLVAVEKVLDQGYKRVKIKITPNSCIDKIALIRKYHPDLSILVDANQSFNESQLDILYKLDEYNIDCIEEPLDPSYIPQSGQRDLLDRLSILQETLTTTICLDESVVSAKDMMEAFKYKNLRCFAIKISKFGGIQPTIDFLKLAKENDFEVWMGGMFDTGVSKRTYAAFETLPEIDFAGDISNFDEYFFEDCAIPALICSQGMLELNPPDHDFGIGANLNKSYIAKILKESIKLVK